MQIGHVMMSLAGSMTQTLHSYFFSLYSLFTFTYQNDPCMYLYLLFKTHIYFRVFSYTELIHRGVVFP